ncbi:MAPEG family protein [Novosphingobium mangrovi (ex Huang et al. 2023)]|uniref:MAPEG family protein n=1 Tax=Novosphingobium mangrovi (ex Huang et al. 2023) TaxID=2976432 RepID=A0ABT2I3H8_9SPHN|nr:MAPEG family protein [Novosphingobium mangrovi (ex Huang et al. 2023)]MCT2399359.1 MAPEG family protein [Novosphingobium mangrovi (ex Huang et al. 2023)]
MVGMAILQPVVALAAWTMVMWFWLFGTRIPALGATKIDPEELVDDPSMSLDNILPAQVQWKAHNYNHLHEAPTVFYAVAIVLAIIGQGDGLNAQVGWAYFGLRVIHSIIQATINKVNLRFGVFALSSFCLMFLVARAALAMF